ncbi:malate dehydrogenase [Cucumis melo var. makuwa]|uniref:Malate dehydrogenase n=1 Tax=Cucumis melo var. makuwa TaxID=1194695 RepID=A0A5D3BCN3_CUCMM|nr:malate dehydrogenase [Cucumis melo var. makuwa]
MIARGLLGPYQPVMLHMLDIVPTTEALNGVKMELIDVVFPLLKGMLLAIHCLSLASNLSWVLNFVYYAQTGVVATTDVVEAYKKVNIAVMVDGFPRIKGMERKDVMMKMSPFTKKNRLQLGTTCYSDCKVIISTHNTP